MFVHNKLLLTALKHQVASGLAGAGKTEWAHALVGGLSVCGVEALLRALPQMCLKRGLSAKRIKFTRNIEKQNEKGNVSVRNGQPTIYLDAEKQLLKFG